MQGHRVHPPEEMYERWPHALQGLRPNEEHARQGLGTFLPKEPKPGNPARAPNEYGQPGYVSLVFLGKRSWDLANAIWASKVAWGMPRTAWIANFFCLVTVSQTPDLLLAMPWPVPLPVAWPWTGMAEKRMWLVSWETESLSDSWDEFGVQVALNVWRPGTRSSQVLGAVGRPGTPEKSNPDEL